MEIDKQKLWYMVAPVAPVEGETREKNLDSATEHFHAILRSGIRVIAPWIAICKCLDESDRAFGISISREVVTRCDGIIAVGPRWSPGMYLELKIAEKLGLEVVNLVGQEAIEVK